MKERPILFSGAMVRALLAGTKTQTRRVVKPARDPNIGCWMTPGEIALDSATVQEVISPYGQPGDRLWVRETWMPDPPRDGTWPHVAFDNCSPRDMSLIPECYRKSEHCLHRADGNQGLHGWTPAIHMFRWASRTTLDVTGLRVERLQDISEADALAEGIVPAGDGNGFQLADTTHYSGNPIDSYFSLWEHINGPGSVEANPWVWVIEFKRLEAA